MKLTKLLVIAGLTITAHTASANLINDMQGCQAVIEFVNKKLESAPSTYSKDDVAAVRKGITAYNKFIQSEIVTPGLLQFNGGDAAKAEAMQKQVDAYKVQLVAGLEKRFAQAGLKTDHAVMINECAKKKVPSDKEELESLKTALQTIIKLTSKG